MAWFALDDIDYVAQQSGFNGEATAATVAYLNSEMELLITNLRRDTISGGRIVELIHRDSELFDRQPSGDGIDLNYELAQLNTKEKLIGWVARQLLIYIILNIPQKWEENTLAPWDIATIISTNPALNQIFGGAGLDDGKLPVSITVNGNQFTHWMTMDLAMGMLLMSHTVGVDLSITMYGAPLTYFRYYTENQNDLYRYHNRYDYDNNVKILPQFEREYLFNYVISMTTRGVTNAYYFNGTDFLRGIKTVAEWLGLEHHAYWRYLVDRDNHPFDFI